MVLRDAVDDAMCMIVKRYYHIVPYPCIYTATTSSITLTGNYTAAQTDADAGYCRSSYHTPCSFQTHICYSLHISSIRVKMHRVS